MTQYTQKCWGASWTGVLDEEVSYYLSRFILLFLLISKGVASMYIYIFKEPLWLAHHEYFWSIEQPPIRSTYVSPTPQNRSTVSSMWHTTLVYIYIYRDIYDNSTWAKASGINQKRKPPEVKCCQIEVKFKFRKYFLSWPSGAHANLHRQMSKKNPSLSPSFSLHPKKKKRT